MISIAYIDHYDSFTFNLIAWLKDAGQPVAIKRIPFDDRRGMDSLSSLRCPLVLSPGPKSPAEAQATLALVRSKLGRVPILGVCLGQQILAHVIGLPIVKSQRPLHGALKRIRVGNHGGIFAGMPQSLDMAAYHSLVAESGQLPPHWQITGRCAEGGEVAALEFRPPHAAWAFGVQFHPESFLSQGADQLRANWYAYIESWQRQRLRPPADLQEVGLPHFP